MPLVLVASLFLVVMPGATSSVLVTWLSVGGLAHAHRFAFQGTHPKMTARRDMELCVKT